jgi:uncharacterized membrane protein YbhN (UPF0104 family)
VSLAAPPHTSEPRRTLVRVLKIAFWLTIAAVGSYLVLPDLRELPDAADAIANARLGWLLEALISSAGTFVSAAVAQRGAVVSPLALGTTVESELAATLANHVTPAGLGSAGVAIRYLLRSGLDRAEAVAASSVSFTVVSIGVLRRLQLTLLLRIRQPVMHRSDVFLAASRRIVIARPVDERDLI